MINALEDTRVNENKMFFSSWDFTKAFDSVTPFFKELAYLRLGVPRDVAVWMDKLDSAGHTIVKTPQASSELAEWVRSRDNHRPVHIRGFAPGKGMGQGDGSSALLWDAFLDVLLKAMEVQSSISDSILIPGYDQCESLSSTTFADDIVAPKPTLEALRREGRLVCAFSILTGVSISEAKLRAFLIDRRICKSAGRHEPTLDVHKFSGRDGHITCPVPLKRNGAFKHLGCIHDLDGSGRTQLRETLKYLAGIKELCMAKARAFPAGTVALALKPRVITKIAYIGGLSSWNAAQIDQLDMQVRAIYKSIALLMPSFPSKLLEISRKRGGLGLMSLSTAIHSTKFTLLLRSLLDGGTARVAAEGLLMRALQCHKGKITKGFQCDLSVSADSRCERHNLWATGLVQWLALQRVTIRRNGSDPRGTSEQLLEDLPIPELDRMILRMRGISVLGDIYCNGQLLPTQALGVSAGAGSNGSATGHHLPRHSQAGAAVDGADARGECQTHS